MLAYGRIHAGIVAFFCLMTAQLGYGHDSKQQFEISAEYLWMIYAIDQPNYAIVSNTTLFPNGPRKALKQNWHSGYRVKAAYYLPNEIDRIRASWTDFNSFSAYSEARGTVVMPILVQPSFSLALTRGSLRNTFNFHYLDILFGRPVYSYKCLQLSLEAGVQYLQLQMKEFALYTDDFTIVRNSSKASGIGPELCFSFEGSLAKHLSIVGSLSGAFVISKTKAQAFNSIEIFLARFTSQNDPYWLATPTLNARIGLKYASSTLQFDFLRWFPFAFYIEGGYEFINVHKGVNRIYFVDGAAVSSTEAHSLNEYMDFTLHGPYVQSGIKF